MALASSLLYQTGIIASETFVLTGPVIGMVSDTTARILVETNVACTVECKLKASGGSGELWKVISTNEKVPKCFVFENLRPETYYRVSLSIPCPGLVKSGFMTMPKGWSLIKSPARMAFVTMNNYAYTRDNVKEKLDLWRSLFKLANTGQIDYLVHLGSNVFLHQDDPASQQQPNSEQVAKRIDDESRWVRAMKQLEGIARDEWSSRYESILEIFRGGYRETWNHPMTKHVLANVPNLMMLNDHDIRSSIGYQTANPVTDSEEYFLSCCAYEVYNQFQRNLFEDYYVQPSPYACLTSVKQAYHFHVFGDIGIMLLDIGAVRTLLDNNSKDPTKEAKEEEAPLLGSRQWKDIEFALGDGGYFADCRMLFVVSPTPPAILGESNVGIFQMCKGREPTKVGAWYSELHIPETSYIFSLLFDWRAKRPGEKEFCIVTSGLGQGFMTDIVDARYLWLGDSRIDRAKQIALGPISNGPPSDESKKLLKQGLRKMNKISPHHQFKHFNVSTDRQFGVIDVYLDYNKLHPQYGIVTKFTARITECDGLNVKTTNRIDASFRLRANFKGTCLSMCDPGTKKLDPLRGDVNDLYVLLSQTHSSRSFNKLNCAENLDGSFAGTYDNISIPQSFGAEPVSKSGHSDGKQSTKSSRMKDDKMSDVKMNVCKTSDDKIDETFSTSESSYSSSFYSSSLDSASRTSCSYESLPLAKEKKGCKQKCGCSD